MKKRLIVILVVIISFCCTGCGDFQRSYDEFKLREINSNPSGYPHYIFEKNIDPDMVFEQQSAKYPDGYRLYGDTQNGQWNDFSFGSTAGYGLDGWITAVYACFSKEGMGDAKLNIYFNYTVASTGERKEEVWEVDFGQEPFEDRREK